MPVSLSFFLPGASGAIVADDQDFCKRFEPVEVACIHGNRSKSGGTLADL